MTYEDLRKEIVNTPELQAHYEQTKQSVKNRPTYEELLEFVQEIARIKAEEDWVEGEEATYYIMENDDAWSDLNRLIHEARVMLGQESVEEE